jgi:hypothetical protein
MKTIKIDAKLETKGMLLLAAMALVAAFFIAGCGITLPGNGGTPSPIVNAGAYAAGQVLSASMKDPAKTEAAIAAREAVKYLDGQPSSIGSVALNDIMGTLLKGKMSDTTYAIIKAGAGILDSFLPPPETLGSSEGAALTKKILRQFLDGLATGGGKGLHGHVSREPGHWLNK